MTGGSHAAPYGDGEVRESIGPALEQAIGEGQVGSLTGSLRQVRRQGSRVLLTRTEAGRVVEAVVMRHGTVAPRAGAGPDGIAWWPESWAQCDWADYSEATTAARGLQVWRTAAGSRVATTSIVSATGSEHCGWQRMTILQLGPALGGGTFVRDPLPELHASFEKPFRAHAPVPADARDTGLRRGGRTLWLPADGSVAYVGSSRADAEQWPATSRPLGCA